MDVILDKANHIIKKSFKNLYKFLNIFFRPNLSENIKVINNLKENALSWFLILVTISIISYPNILLGIITFFVFLFIAYFYHLATHVHKNIFSIVHHYHHENDNFFSHFIQIIFDSIMVYNI